VQTVNDNFQILITVVVRFCPPSFYSRLLLAPSTNEKTTFRMSSVGPTRDQFFRYTPVIRFLRFCGENEHRHCLSRAFLLFLPIVGDRRRRRREQKGEPGPNARMHVESRVREKHAHVH